MQQHEVLSTVMQQQQEHSTPDSVQQQQQLSAENHLVSQVLAIDAANRQALDQLYESWHDQVTQAEQHNTAALALHRQASQQHAAKLAAYRHLYQVWQQKVQQLEAAAKQAYEQAVSRAAEEDAALAQLHEQEVQEKQAREQQHAQVRVLATLDGACHQGLRSGFGRERTLPAAFCTRGCVGDGV
jgi:uncharacterized sporulation protein YeaH/YhbH (DUF444 family)